MPFFKRLWASEATPDLIRGWEPVFRKDHAPPKSWSANRFDLKRLRSEKRNERRGLFALAAAKLLELGEYRLHVEVEIDLRAQAERDRIERGQVRRIPVGALADRLDGRLGRADEPHDLRILELGMVAHQPEDGVRTVLAARYRCI